MCVSAWGAPLRGANAVANTNTRRAHIVSASRGVAGRRRYDATGRPNMPRTRKKPERYSEAARLTQLRTTAGLSQRDIADVFRVTKGAIAQWETSERTIPGPVLALIDIYEEHLWPRAASDVCEGGIEEPPEAQPGERAGRGLVDLHPRHRPTCRIAYRVAVAPGRSSTVQQDGGRPQRPRDEARANGDLHGLRLAGRGPSRPRAASDGGESDAEYRACRDVPPRAGRSAEAALRALGHEAHRCRQYRAGSSSRHQDGADRCGQDPAPQDRGGPRGRSRQRRAGRPSDRANRAEPTPGSPP